jgi:hypothetical protein
MDDRREQELQQKARYYAEFLIRDLQPASPGEAMLALSLVSGTVIRGGWPKPMRNSIVDQYCRTIKGAIELLDATPPPGTPRQ